MKLQPWKPAGRRIVVAQCNEMDDTVLASLLAQVARHTACRPPAQPPQAAASQALDAQLINSSEFRMFCFKILPCTRRYGHDWTACPFCHPGEKATRRCPQKHNYMPLACPDIKRSGECPRRHACNYAHNVFEFWCHPLRFRTQMCSYGPECKRSICFFAHSYSELRVVDQSLLQELERQMDLLGEGAGFGFPPANRGRSPRDEMMAFTPRELRRTAEELQHLAMLPSRSGGEGADAADPAALCSADGSSQHDTTDPTSSGAHAEGGPASGQDAVSPSAPGSCADSVSNLSSADTSTSGMEPSLAALQLLQLQAMAQQRQTPAPATVPVERMFSQEKLGAAAVLLGVDVGYLAQALQSMPPPPARPMQQPSASSAAVLQALVKQYMGTPSSPAASPMANSLNSWLPSNNNSNNVGNNNNSHVGKNAGMSGVASMLLEAAGQHHAGNAAAGGANRGFGGQPESPLPGLGSALPSLRANEDQMAATMKLLAEIAAAARKPAPAPAAAAPADPMQALLQHLQEQLTGRLPGTSSVPGSSGSEQHPATTDMHAGLGNVQLSLDIDRLGKLMETMGAGKAVGSAQTSASSALTGTLSEPGHDMAAAIMNMLSQMSTDSGAGGGASSAQDIPTSAGSHSYYGTDTNASIMVGSPVNLSTQPSLGTGSAFGNPNAAALAVAAMQANTAAKSAAHHHAASQPFSAFAASGLWGTARNPAAGLGSKMHGGAGPVSTSGNSTSPVDVLSMQSAHSGHADSGTASSAGSDGSGSPTPGDRASADRITHVMLAHKEREESEGVEAADLAAHPDLQNAHSLLGTLSELVGDAPDRSVFSLRTCNSLRVGAASFVPSQDNSPRRPLMGSVSSPLGAFDFINGSSPFCVQPAVSEATESAMPQVPTHFGSCLMEPASPCAAVALLTPAGTGSFNAHDFPAEL